MARRPGGREKTPRDRRAPGYGGLFVRRHVLHLLAEPLNAKPHDIARLEEHRRLLAKADARRGAGGDDVAGLQAHKLAEIGDAVANAEQHRLRRAVLIAVAIDPEPHGQALRVRDLVAGNEPGADGTEGVAGLAL